MRSSRALRFLQTGPTQLPRTKGSPHAYHNTISWSARKGYCSACETIKAEPVEGIDPSKAPVSTAASSIAPVKNASAPAADHRELGIQQKLFVFSKYSPGSPLFLPNGTRLFNKLTNFLRAQYTDFGFKEVITPIIYKSSLWHKSGHWDNYADDMYSVTGRGASGKEKGTELEEDQDYGLKPMNCPGHCLLFASIQRSYRDLPIRFADFSSLHRNEVHGALSGLTRVRRFHQDDGHIFCRPSQIKEEISRTLKFVELTYKVLGLGPYRLCLSTRPPDHFIGKVEEWDNAEAALRESLDDSKQEWTLNPGDGAFYGPKIDIILTDSDGKDHQTATIQLDFQLPKRFGLQYQAPAPELEEKGQITKDPKLLDHSGFVTPVLIHRAVLGSVERIMALLIEHYNGKWPFWLNPHQVAILTLNDSEPLVAYAESCRRSIQGQDERTTKGAATNTEKISVDIDASAKSLALKIALARQKGYGIIAVVGNRDQAANQVTAEFSSIPEVEAQIQWCQDIILHGSRPAGADGAQESTEINSVMKYAGNRKYTISPKMLKKLLEALQGDYR